PERKTWIAVCMTATQAQEAHDLIGEVLQKTGFKELHFVDIWNRNGEVKNLSSEDVYAFFEFATKLFESCQYPILVQTLSPDTLKEQPIIPIPDNMNPELDPNSVPGRALYFLLYRVIEHIKLRPDLCPISIFVDAGLRPSGTSNQLGEGPLSYLRFIHFGSSDSILQLQLADFAAFVWNRMQWVATKPKMSEMDMRLLDLISAANLNWIDALQVTLNPSRWTVADYDSHLETDRVVKGLKPRPWSDQGGNEG
ncbi:MAG: hypothetical protein ABIQ95_00190, partial [Bdellovibrionia bacterium]